MKADVLDRWTFTACIYTNDVYGNESSSDMTIWYWNAVKTLLCSVYGITSKFQKSAISVLASVIAYMDGSSFLLLVLYSGIA